MRKLNIFVVMLTLAAVCIFTSEVSADVRGKVTESNGSGIPEAVVSLFNKADSTMVATGMTDASGDFLIKSEKVVLFSVWKGLDSRPNHWRPTATNL